MNATEQASSENQGSLYERALRLNRDWKSNILALAQTLVDLRKDCPAEFADWLSRPDVSRRRSYYLVEIAKKYEKIPVDRERLNALGWTKLKVMVGHVTDDNATNLIELAERSTVVQLRQRLAAGAEDRKIQSMVLNLSPEQHADLSRALELNGAKRARRGLSGKEEAIAELARIFLLNRRQRPKK